ncbi:unnamed protein product, partial [Medioppia subpectinata]
SSLAATPRTPGSSVGGQTPLATPLRDKLAINAEEALVFEGDERSAKQQQKETRETLRKALSALPAPKNEYEIVVNDEEDMDESADAGLSVEDQADLDDQRERRRLEALEEERRRQSQPVQRQLPRPADVNNSILRTGAQAADPQMSAIQRAEELIKEEMLVMLHYDAVHNPTDSQLMASSYRSARSGNQSNPNAVHTTFLEKHPYVKYSKDQLAAAKQVLQTEMDVVKQGMAHTELTLDGYCQVWDECLSQVLYLPSQHKYTRANLVNKKDRIESLEKRPESVSYDERGEKGGED